MAFSKTDQKRVTILALMKLAVALEAEDLETAYNDAVEFAGTFEDDGLFDGGGDSGNSRSSGRSGRSGGRGSGSRSSNRGNRGRGGRGGGDRDAWRDDDATDKQIDALYAAGAGDDYSDSEIEGMTKGEASNLLDDLN